jgi:hypothetical protein
VGGTYGFYWNDTSSPGNSFGLVFEHVRTEQRDDTTAYSFYFGRTGSPIETVTLNDCYLDTTANGIFWRKIRKLSLNHCTMGAINKVILDGVSEIGDALDLHNCVVPVSGTSTVSLTGYRLMWAGEKAAAASPIAATAHYAHDTNSRACRLLLDGLDRIAFKGSLADDATLSLECGSALANTMALITVGSHGATTDEGMICLASTGTNVFKIGGTVNTSVVVNGTDGTLAVYRSAASIIYRNRMGETVDYIVTVDARI